MGPISGTVVFILIWWVVIFMTLPLKINRVEGEALGVDSGAPSKANIKFKLKLTTLISVIVWIIYYMLVEYEVLTIEMFR